MLRSVWAPNRREAVVLMSDRGRGVRNRVAMARPGGRCVVSQGRAEPRSAGHITLVSGLIGKPITVQFVNWSRRDGADWRACYGTGHLLGWSEFDFNVGVLGRRWFANGVTEDTDGLIIHELGHEFCTNHADTNYYRALTKLGARLKAAALAEPDWFRRFQRG